MSTAPDAYPPGTLRALLHTTLTHIRHAISQSSTPENEAFAVDTMERLEEWGRKLHIERSGTDSLEFRFRDLPSQYAETRRNLIKVGSLFRDLQQTIIHPFSAPPAKEIPFLTPPSSPSAPATRPTPPIPKSHLFLQRQAAKALSSKLSLCSQNSESESFPDVIGTHPSIPTGGSMTPLYVSSSEESSDSEWEIEQDEWSADEDTWEDIGEPPILVNLRSQLRTAVPTLLTSLTTLHTSLPPPLFLPPVNPQTQRPLKPLLSRHLNMLSEFLRHVTPTAATDIIERASLTAHRAHKAHRAMETRATSPVYLDAEEAPAAEAGYVVVSAENRSAEPLTKDVAVPKGPLPIGEKSRRIEPAVVEEKRLRGLCTHGVGQCYGLNPEKGRPGWKEAMQQTLSMPQAPEIINGEGTCPLCNTIFSAAEFEGERWQAHIIRDLKPYFCPDKTCPNWSQVSQDRANFSAHLAQHAGITQCPFCGVSETDDMVTHLEGHMVNAALAGMVSGCEMASYVRALRFESCCGEE